MRNFAHIIGPKEGHAAQRVRTPDDYRRAQADFLSRQRAAGVTDAVPHEATEAERSRASVPYINRGQWLMDCACRNAPSVSVEWELACCFECGAIYQGGLVFPSNREALERVVAARARNHRNWTPTESLEDVRRDNLARGDEVPD